MRFPDKNQQNKHVGGLIKAADRCVQTSGAIEVPSGKVGERNNMKVHAKKAFAFVCGIAATIIVVGAMSVMSSQPAAAKPEFAAQTGKPCGTCHENPAGGGKLKSFGEKFKANGFKLSK